MTYETKKDFSVDVLSIYMGDLKRYKLLSPQEDRELIEKAKSDSEARKKLLVHHLVDVVKVATKLSMSFGYEVSDLIEVGNFGLVELINKIEQFHGDSGFSTWVYSSIRNYLLTEISRRTKHKLVGLDKLTLVSKETTDIESNEKEERLEKALHNLNPEEYNFIQQRFNEKKSLLRLAEYDNAKMQRLRRKQEKILKKLVLAMSA